MSGRVWTYVPATHKTQHHGHSRTVCLGPGRRRSSGSRSGYAHGLRHTHAAQLRVEVVDIGIISRQLGHRSIATTARYLDHIAPQAVIDAMRRRCWGCDSVAATMAAE